MEMRAGLPVDIEEITGGHLKSSSKVISRNKGELTENFWQACVCNHWKGYLSGSLKKDIEMLAVVEYVTRGYWRSLTKVKKIYK